MSNDDYQKIVMDELKYLRAGLDSKSDKDSHDKIISSLEKLNEKLDKFMIDTTIAITEHAEKQKFSNMFVSAVSSGIVLLIYVLLA